MKIGIDARFWGLQHAGLGRYVMELVEGLVRVDKKNQYRIFLRKNYLKQLSFPDNFKKVKAEISHYSLEEQWYLAEIFSSQQLDLLHVPHFNVPIRYKKPFVVTIHDLLWHEVKGLSVTTQNTLIYLAKYFGYRIVVKHALDHSRYILVPSNTIKEKLVNQHKIQSERISVTYEAPSKNFRVTKKASEVIKKYHLTFPFVLYVGSAYPHKNILAAVEAVKQINTSGNQITLIISSSRSVFLNKLISQIKIKKSSEFVKIFHLIPDEDLATIMNISTALIQPSFSEGFGLTGLEAMSAGTPVIASKLPIFQEIYNDAAIFIDPNSPSEIAENIITLLKKTDKRNELVKKGKKRMADFSWNRLVKKTLAIYEKIDKKLDNKI